MSCLVEVCINDENLSVDKNLTLFTACNFAGFILPRFCYHENLPTAGNCRACLVEIQNLEKPVAACITDIEPNLMVWTENIFSKKARENLIEVLLLNHPLDCPICDQAGECDLQEQAKKVGTFSSRFFFSKRGVLDKSLNFFIKTIMTRCIHCTRCVRFTELLDTDHLGVLNRGTSTEISNYMPNTQVSELLGNVIDLCPVGALTARTYAFKTRPWEVKTIESLDLTDGLGASIYIHYKDSEIIKISPKPNHLLNGNIITDKCRFSADAFKTNILRQSYAYDTEKAFYSKINWAVVRSSLRRDFTASPCRIFISEKLDLQSLVLFRKICNSSRGRVKLSVIANAKSQENFFVYRLMNTVADMELNSRVCLLLSSNIRLECAILNFKLRLKFKKTMLSVFCLGGHSSADNVSSYLALRQDSLVDFSGGRMVKVSLLCTSFRFPLILAGESFLKRLLYPSDFFLSLRTKIPGAKILQINLTANKGGIHYFGLKNNFIQVHNKKRVTPVKALCFLVNDTIFINSVFSNKNLYLERRANNSFSQTMIPLKLPKKLSSSKILAWLTTYKPRKRLHVTYILPTFNYLNFQGLYINLECKLQKTEKFLTQRYEGQSLVLMVSWMFIKDFRFLDFLLQPKHFAFFEELLIIPAKFLYTNKIFNPSVWSLSVGRLPSHPIKPCMLDFYSGDTFVRNSKQILISTGNAVRSHNSFIKI